MTTIKQQAAIAHANGQKYFIPEQPCKHGHTTERHATGRFECVECKQQQATLRREIVNRQHKERHARRTPEQVLKDKLRTKLIRDSRTPEQKLKDNAVHLQWQRDHPEKQSAMVMRWQKANKDKMRIIGQRHNEKKKANANL